MNASSLRFLEGLEAMRVFSRQARAQGRSIGFVPTMGALHEGHQSLIRRAREENDLVVVSVFVNPLQFGPAEDFTRYPRDLEGDTRKITQAGGDALFTVTAEEMYPKDDFATFVMPEGVAEKWEGASRPGHFCGVLTVVLKLFQIVAPARAYFGRKDAQQLFLVQRMVRDLNLDLQIVPCPTLRESDGLAMSSRNAYLAKPERSQALALSRALRAALEAYRGASAGHGEREAAALLAQARRVLDAEPGVALDYLALVDPATFHECFGRIETARIIVAARVGKTRLIDNMFLSSQEER